tara:strand:+ start:1409 stop:1930 length:522 start_codon:yes stop_codon:yes gene_type:complete
MALSTINSNAITDGTIATGDIADDAVTAAKASGLGISEADQWRLTSNKSGTGDITANLERPDTAGFAYLGTGMTQSSGIFTFPSTGIYRIQATFETNENSQNYIQTTTDNSNYVNATIVRAKADGNHTGSFIFDVTNTSTHKVKFNVTANTGVTIGSTDFNRTYFEFIRLGDT